MAVLLDCSVQELGAVRLRLAETSRQRRHWAWLLATEGHLQLSVFRAHIRFAKPLSQWVQANHASLLSRVQPEWPSQGQGDLLP